MLRSCVQAKLWLLCALSLGLLMVSSCQSSAPVAINMPSLTDRERDGLIGNVKAALIADIVLTEQNSEWREGQQASSTIVYDAAGKRISQTPFRVAMSNGYAITQHEAFFDPAGKGLFKLDSATKKYVQHDDKGNVVEKGAQANGQNIAELRLQYEFDARGNWIKRSISRLTAKDGNQVLLPSEVSRRYLVYFDAGNDAPPKAVPASAEASQLKAPMAATPEALDAGKAQFLQRCAACHGENGKAQTDFAAAMTTKPADLTGSKIGALSEGEIYSFIRDGISAGGMPAFKSRISDESIWRIALFVKQLSRASGGDNLLAKASPSVKPSATPEAERRYTLNGKVLSIERDLKQVLLEHEEIKGYMEAMTMPFSLPDEKMLNKLKKDDRIQATLVVGVGYWRLENVVVK